MNKKYKIIIGNVLSLLIILSAVIFMFQDVIFNQKIISGSDMMTAYYPYHAFYAEELKQFKIASWNPYMGLGFPSYAEGQISAFNPINLICFSLFSPGIAITASLILCVFFCCIFMYLYARITNMSYSASIFCAFAFGLGTSYIGQFSGAMPFIKTLMFLPLIFYCIEKMLINLNLKSITFLSVSLALVMIGGHAQAAFYCLLASGLYIVLNVLFRDSTFKNKLLVLDGFAFAFIISFGLSAIQLIPTLELKRLSLRWGPFDVMTMTSGSFAVSWLQYFLKPIKSAPYYIGILPLIFSPFGILKIKKDKYVLSYLLLLFFFFILSFGRDLLPLYKILAHLPGFNNFRYCGRIIYIAVFFLVLLSGKGLDFIIGIISKIKIHRFIRLSLRYSIAIIIPLLLFIDLEKANEITTSGPPNSHPSYEKLKYSDYLNVSEGSLLKLLKQLQQENKLMRVATDFGHLPENLLSQFKIPSFCLNGGAYSPLNLVRIQWLANKVFLYKHYEVLSLLGINYFVSYNRTPPAVDWELIFNGVDRNFNLITESWFNRDSEIFVFKNKKALPRIFMVSNVDCKLPTGDKRFNVFFYEKIVRKELDVENTVYIEETFDFEKLKSIVPLKYKIEVTEFLPNRITLRTIQNRNAFLVMNDAYYPGWKAYINGKKSKIYLANGACRALFVPKGEHKIEFEYNPFSYRIGKYITLATILMILFFTKRSGLRSRLTSQRRKQKNFIKYKG